MMNTVGAYRIRPRNSCRRKRSRSNQFFSVR